MILDIESIQVNQIRTQEQHSIAGLHAKQFQQRPQAVKAPQLMTQIGETSVMIAERIGKAAAYFTFAGDGVMPLRLDPAELQIQQRAFVAVRYNCGLTGSWIIDRVGEVEVACPQCCDSGS